MEETSRRASREMPRHVVSIIRVDAGLAVCHSEARLVSRATQNGGVLSSSGRTSGILAAEQGPNARVLKGVIPFREIFPSRDLLSALFRNLWQIVAEVS